jgi:hypothetical protein
MKNTGARNNITTAYMFGELSLPLMTPVFVDGEAGLALTAPALEGGLILHLRTLSHNVLRAEAQRKSLKRPRSDDPPQRIEHLSGGRLYPRGAHHPQGETLRLPSDLHAQILPGNLMSPLEHRVVLNPMAWSSHTHTHTHVRVATRVPLGPFCNATTRLSSHRELTLISDLNLSPLHCPRFLFHPKTIADRSRRAFIIL